MSTLLGVLVVAVFVAAVLMFFLRRPPRAPVGLAPREIRCDRCGRPLPEWYVDELGPEQICRACSESLPYPEPGETEDAFVARYSRLRAEARAAEERERQRDRRA